MGEKIVQAVQRNQPVVAAGAEVHLARWQWRLLPGLSRLFARFDLTSRGQP